MQEYIWILCEELDPEESWDEFHMKNLWAFTDFESAKDALRKLMRRRSCTENRVFDGKGGIRGLSKQIQKVVDWQEGDDREEYGRAILKGLHDLFVEGKDFPGKYNDGFTWSNWMIECFYGLDADDDYYFSVGSDTDGPTNGIDPKIYINTFHMDNPAKTYICRLECQFDDWKDEDNGFWSVTLKRVRVNQFT